MHVSYMAHVILSSEKITYSVYNWSNDILMMHISSLLTIHELALFLYFIAKHHKQW